MVAIMREWLAAKCTLKRTSARFSNVNENKGRVFFYQSTIAKSLFVFARA